MSKHYVCVHGHFYQPPRENPWSDIIEPQPSAHPYNDWNERILDECYRPNTESRILDDDGGLDRVINNYARMSFNFGPTLLTWMERSAPQVHAAIVAADGESVARFGHGSAMAQGYNHTILPLANDHDRNLQVRWGVEDFWRRFGRRPEGMWLPETAVNTATLETLAANGLAFTVLAPHQARRHRLIGDAEWCDDPIDTHHTYRANLPSGRSLDLFFYDGGVASSVAFQGVLDDGHVFARRLLHMGAGLAHIATDGESYGHHHRHGDMALAYALDHIDRGHEAELINYASFRVRHPADREVQIAENTSWSCAHGVERWRSDCGCNSGGKPGWHQRWRGPLRSALDWLRDELARVSAEPPASRKTAPPDMLTMMRRNAQLMYTSCGWFFDDISGIETVQIIEYAARAIELAQHIADINLEPGFLERLAQAPSNLAKHGNGQRVYETCVRKPDR